MRSRNKKIWMGISVSPLSSLKNRHTKEGKHTVALSLSKRLLWESSFPLGAIIWHSYQCPTSPWSSRDSKGNFAVLAASMMSCAIWALSSRVISRQNMYLLRWKRCIYSVAMDTPCFLRLLKPLALHDAKHADRPAFIWEHITPGDCIYPTLDSWHVSTLGKKLIWMH